MRFCEASAKDNFNVDEIFLKLVDDILSKVGVFCLLRVMISSCDWYNSFRMKECFHRI